MSPLSDLPKLAVETGLLAARHYPRWRKKNSTQINLSYFARSNCRPQQVDMIRVTDFKEALETAAGCVSHFLDVAAGQLGLDHDRVLMGRYSFPVICRLLHLAGGHFTDAAETGRVLYWYIHSALWGRYAGSTETALNQDFGTASRSGIGGLIGSLERWRGGNLVIDGQDFAGSGRGSRFFPLLNLLSWVHAVRDFGNGLSLSAHLSGQPGAIQAHHVFPKAVLYAAGYGKGQVNAVANFCFLNRETSLVIGKRAPEEYFGAIEAMHPGALASQWIPEDPALWRVGRYPDSLRSRARRQTGQIKEAAPAAPRSEDAAISGSGLSRYGM